MNAMTWNDLPLIDDVLSLDETDNQCLEEIRRVMQRHAKTQRFGVTLLHHHFSLSNDELLVEHCDFDRRMLVTTPQRASEISERGYRPTVWRFDGMRAHACAYCPTHEDNDGNSKHDGYKEQWAL